MINKISLVLVLLLFLPLSVVAKRSVDLPLNIGFGPAFNYFPQIISDDQMIHYSLKLNMYAVLDRELIEQNKARVPKKYRGFIEGKDEIKITYIFIPESIIISPEYRHTGIYGANFRPLSIGIPLLKSKDFKSNINLGINITYMFIHSDTIFDKSGSMNFFRPGINIQLDNNIRISKKFLFSFGIDTYFYIPQEIRDGSPILEIGNSQRWIWFCGQPYLMVNLRLPYKTKI